MSARTVTIKENILQANREKAECVREQLRRRGILMINIMSSPGSGKTSLILRTIDRLREMFRIAVIEGDVSSSLDADRIARENIPAIQINTDGGCHLDAAMI
ncbi:MAG TPA: GTP-binding protein, partial [Acidobacteriota bacterium]|nr:GTP-binding protein [Acidobacteriota bacterium]